MIEFVVLAECSYAQCRIYLDEQMRFESSNKKSVAIYNLPFLYRLSERSLSIESLRQALRQITKKHSILRTCLRFDTIHGNLIQYVQNKDWFELDVSIIDDDNHLKMIFNDEMTNRRHFDLNEGRVFRCHILRRRSSSVQNDDLLSVNDWIIFNFHHIAFDGESEQIFLDDLQQFYNDEQKGNNQQTILQYIDCKSINKDLSRIIFYWIILDTIHEQQMDMTKAKMYWRQVFQNYTIEKSMTLPVDREFSPNNPNTGQGFSVTMDFNRNIVNQLVDYASDLNVTLYQVCLTIYYIFLFKLTGGEQDLVVGIVQSNRYRPELRCLIGMFVNTLPMLIHLDLQDTFEQLLNKVSTMIVESQPHSYLPYQQIIDQIIHKQNFIETMFTLDEDRPTSVRLNDGSAFESCSIHSFNDIGILTNGVAMFDMTLSMEYNPKIHSLRAELTASTDLFHSSTVLNIARRFHLLIEQLFSSVDIVSTKQSIGDLSLTLPEEFLCLQSELITTNHIIGRASFSQMRIWFDQQINFQSKKRINNISFFYEIIEGSLSIQRFHRALRSVVLKHSSLRTFLFFDSSTDCLLQQIVEAKDDEEELFVFIEHPIQMDMDIKSIIFDNHSDFDLSNNCALSVHCFIQENADKDVLPEGNFVVFNFDQSLFDVRSLNIFSRDLSIAYQSETTFSCNSNEFRYIDCEIN